MKPSANRIEVKAMRLSHGMGLPLPQYQSEEAAGLDLLAAVPLTTPLRLLPGMRQLVPTGLTLEIPPGFEGQVRPRSGLALNHGVTVLNSPGTIDSDYRGEVKVLLINLGRETFVITRGQRIAQLIFQSVARAEMIDVRAVAASRRGEAGFGSTGVASEPVKAAPPPAPRAPVVPKISYAPSAQPPVHGATPASQPPPAAAKIAAASVKPAVSKSAAAPKQAAAEKPAPSPQTVKAKPPTAAPSVAKGTSGSNPAGKTPPTRAPQSKAALPKATPGKAATGKALAPKAAAPAAKGKREPAKKQPPVPAKRPAVTTKAKVPARA